MSIHELLTNLQVTPGFNPASTDEAGSKRETFDPAEGSEYRDRLARSINSPAKSSPQPAESSPPANSSDRPKPEAPANEQNKATVKPAKQATPKTEAPEPDAASPPPQASADKVKTADAASTTDSVVSETVVVDQQPVAEPGTESESTIDSELSAAALALLTITAAAPINAGINLELPAAPPGVQELLGSTSVEPAGTLVPEVSMTNCEPPVPPAGLVESFALPVTSASSTTSAQVKTDNSAELQTPSSDASQNLEFHADVSAQATLDGTQEVAETSQTTPNAAVVSTPAPTAEAIPAEATSSSKSGQLERANGVSTAAVAAAATQSSDQTRAHEEREKERARENEARARATVAKGSLQESSAESEESSDDEESKSGRSAGRSEGKSSSSSALPSIVDILTTELIVDEGQSTIDSSETGVKDSTSDPSANPLLNSAPAPSRSTSPTTSTTAIAAGKITQHQAQQLVDRVSNALHQSAQTGQSLKVRLSPPELGVLQIEVTQRDGVLSARLEAQTASAHQTLVDNLSSLREALAQTGTVVERIEVHVAANRGSDSSQDQSERRQQNAEQQNPQQQQRRDDGQQNQNKKREPHIRKGVRSMDQLDIQI